MCVACLHLKVNLQHGLRFRRYLRVGTCKHAVADLAVSGLCFCEESFSCLRLFLCCLVRKSVCTSKVCSSTDLLHLLENRLRCPGIDLSAVSVALLELSMALGKSHAILDGLLPFQKRVSVLSDLPLISRLVRLSHTHAPGLGALGIK